MREFATRFRDFRDAHPGWHVFPAAFARSPDRQQQSKLGRRPTVSNIGHAAGLKEQPQKDPLEILMSGDPQELERLLASSRDDSSDSSDGEAYSFEDGEVGLEDDAEDAPHARQQQQEGQPGTLDTSRINPKNKKADSREFLLGQWVPWHRLRGLEEGKHSGVFETALAPQRQAEYRCCMILRTDGQSVVPVLSGPQVI